MAKEKRATDEVSFDVSPHAREIIRIIAERSMEDLTIARRNDPWTLLDITMDLTAVHANGCPLRLASLANADGFNFAHDILGIRTHLNRDTGKLENCFRPRFAA